MSSRITISQFLSKDLIIFPYNKVRRVLQLKLHAMLYNGNGVFVFSIQ
jgi:hypothetical protein